MNTTFGNKKIDTINRGMIKAWVRDMLQTLFPKTVKDYLTQVRGVFNVAINISLPKHTKKEVSTLLKEANEWYRLFLVIIFYTGIRTGEALALMPSDIDLDNKIIHIRKSMSGGNLSTPKTQGSIRTVPILSDLVPYLRKLPKTTWLFPQKNGKLYARVPGQKKEAWKKLLGDCNIPYRKLYATRHTFIVSMIKNSDLSILEIAQMAGHNSTQMIIQNYGKFIKGAHLKIDREIKLFTDKSTDSDT